jgi:hypothetical protein
MNATIFETNCGEWDVFADCNADGDCRILKGFVSEQAAMDAVANLGWRLLGTVRILFAA